jgi:glycosyltransferase involved in cell wall biosynthesis
MPKAGLLCSIASWLIRVPVRLHTYTGQVWSLLPENSFKRKLLVFVDIIISKLNTECFTDSKSQSIFLARHGVISHSNMCKFFGEGSLNGIDFNRLCLSRSSLKFLSSKAYYLQAKEKITCAYIARKSVDKGFIDFISIALKLRALSDNYRFLFIGPDESNGILSDILRENSLPCSWFICLDYVEDFENYILISDLLLMPSHREGFGSIVIEASYLGVPTIGYRIDGLIDSVSDGNTGILVAENDIKSFVQSVELLRKNRDIYERLSKNGHRRAADYFSSEKIFSEYYTYLKHVTMKSK